MGLKTLPTIWGTYMKLVTKYQISAINSCCEKCYEKCAYMFNDLRREVIVGFVYIGGTADNHIV
jgi:hypothetical protein